MRGGARLGRRRRRRSANRPPPAPLASLHPGRNARDRFRSGGFISRGSRSRPRPPPSPVPPLARASCVRVALATLRATPPELLRDPEFARGCWEIIKRVDPPAEENAFDGGAIEGRGWNSNNPFLWGTGGGGLSPPTRCQPPDRSELLRLYCSFGEGRTVGDVLLMNKGLLEAISHHR